jgi:hypothetical protein
MKYANSTRLQRLGHLLPRRGAGITAAATALLREDELLAQVRHLWARRARTESD